MGFLLSCLFRWLLWFLLTADGSAENLLIGVALAPLLPHARGPCQPLAPLLRALWRALVALPLAYGEALALIAGGHEQERWLEQPASAPSQRLVIFLEVLAITLIPFTLVLGLNRLDGDSTYRIHQLRPLPWCPRTSLSRDD